MGSIQFLILPVGQEKQSIFEQLGATNPGIRFIARLGPRRVEGQITEATYCIARVLRRNPKSVQFGIRPSHIRNLETEVEKQGT